MKKRKLKKWVKFLLIFSFVSFITLFMSSIDTITLEMKILLGVLLDTMCSMNIIFNY